MFLKRYNGVSEPTVQRSSTKNRCIWIIHKIHSKKPLCLFNRVAVLRACNFVKDDSNTCIFCQIYKVFKNNYFEERLWTSASKHYLKRDSNSGASCEFCKLFKNTYFLEDLRTACSETPVRRSFFKNVASLTAWKLLTVLERDCRTGISLWILRNF